MSRQPAHHRITRIARGTTVGVAALGLALGLQQSGQAQKAPPTSSAAPASAAALQPHYTDAVAHDTSPRLSSLSNAGAPHAGYEGEQEERAEEITPAPDNGFAGDPAVQGTAPPAAIGSTRANFEGLSNQDNFNVFGFRVNPPDPVGDVGPNHYVEMVNLVFGVYSKTGTLLLGPVIPVPSGRASR